jgi:transcriptional regulator with XRE-family HTH domain
MKSSFGQRLRQLRGNKKQSEICSLFGVKQSAYSSWERGEKEPTLTAIGVICRHFHASADWLIGIEPERPAKVAEAPAVYSASPAGTRCPDCAAKDATITALSLSVADLSAALRSDSAQTPIAPCPPSG